MANITSLLQGQGPSAKEKKYDRQLRLWAASGQKSLEEAKILLLLNSDSGVVGFETLKNLILPGVGSFTIVDDRRVSEEDLGVNFFLEEKSLGKWRAEESCRLLRELNPEVRGQAVCESTKTFLENLERLKEYSLVLLIDPYLQIQPISAFAFKQSIPLFYVHCIGFYSHFSIQLPSQFPILDTHPDPASTQDLRLLNPWTELRKFQGEKSDALAFLNDHDHGHVPYLLLLLYYLREWRALHDNCPPANYAEKKEFKATVERGARTDNAEGGEENFEEAAAAVLKSLNPSSVPSGLQEVFDEEECKSPTPLAEDFWIIAHGILKFYTAHHVLPLPGTLPDMKSQSADYIKLQKLYKDKARVDAAEVHKMIKSSGENQCSRVPDIQAVEAFCKGASFVKLIKGRRIRLPFLDRKIEDWSDRAKYMCQELADPESLLPIYTAFLAFDHDKMLDPSIPHSRTATQHSNHSPRAFLTDMINDLAKMAGDTGLDTSVPLEVGAKVIEELQRADGAELHNIAALTGGMVAQEAIKVLTKQYVPVNNTCVFDGISSRTATFNL